MIETKTAKIAEAFIREYPDSPLTLLSLTHDADGRYRWHQASDGADTEVSGSTQEEAMDAAHAAWRGWNFTLLTTESAAAALAAGEVTIHQIADATGWPIVNDLDRGHCLIPEPNMWHADDGNAEVEGEFETGEEAAQDYVFSGEWGEITETSWITVYVWREGIDAGGEFVPHVNRRKHKIALEPEEPECIEGEEHDWQNPASLVGGCKENPGVYGHGGGVTIREVCMRCGCGKLTDTWAQDPEDGQQGLTSVSYEPGQYEVALELQPDPDPDYPKADEPEE